MASWWHRIQARPAIVGWPVWTATHELLADLMSKLPNFTRHQCRDDSPECSYGTLDISHPLTCPSQDHHQWIRSSSHRRGDASRTRLSLRDTFNDQSCSGEQVAFAGTRVVDEGAIRSLGDPEIAAIQARAIEPVGLAIDNDVPCSRSLAGITIQRERVRLARELHDDVAPSIASSRIGTGHGPDDPAIWTRLSTRSRNGLSTQRAPTSLGLVEQHPPKGAGSAG